MCTNTHMCVHVWYECEMCEKIGHLFFFACGVSVGCVGCVRLLMQKLICKHKELIPDLNVKTCQPI